MTIDINTTFIGGYVSDTMSYSDAANFTNGIPSDTNDIAVSASARYGIRAYDDSSTNINSFNINNGHTKSIGSDVNGVAQYLQLSFSDATDGELNLSGSGTTYIESNYAKAINVNNAGSGVESTDTPSTYLTGEGNISTLVQCEDGIVGLGWREEEVFETDELKVNAGTVLIGRKATKTDGSSPIEVTINNGVIKSKSSLKLIDGNGGKVIMLDGDLSQMDAENTMVYMYNDGTITDGYIGLTGGLDLETGNGEIQINSDLVYEGGYIRDLYERISDVTIYSSSGINDTTNIRMGIDRKFAIENVSDSVVSSNEDGKGVTITVYKMKTSN